MREEVVVEVRSFYDFIMTLDFSLAVDSYQRPYVWDENKIQELIDDLLAYLKETKELKYYMGTILLHKKDKKYFIIDGQQRITTLMILYFTLFGKLPSDKIQLSYNSPISVQYIQKAKELFSRYKDRFKYKKGELFEDITFTFVKTISEDLAFTFFDTQNNRGVKLSATDLLKAYHLRTINGKNKKEFQEKSAKKWESIQTIESLFPSNYDFIELLYKKFIWRAREWKGQQQLLKETDEKLLESFQKNILKNNDNKINLYPNKNNQYALYLDNQEHRAIKINQEHHFDRDLPFILRQPIDGGLGFFYFTQKYADMLQYVFNKKDIQDKEILAFREFYTSVYEHLSIYLKEFFVLCILLYFDKFESERLLEFSLWLDHLLGAIRIKKAYVFEQAPLKFLKESSVNLLDVISNAFLINEVIDYMRIEAKCIDGIYNNEIIETSERVQGIYKSNLLNYYKIEFEENKEENYLKNKKDWITQEFIKNKILNVGVS